VDAAGTARRQILIGMDALDGKGIAGWLFEHFGSEMTTVTRRCKHCGDAVIDRGYRSPSSRSTHEHLVPSRAVARAETW
jgi:hypothetical protein